MANREVIPGRYLHYKNKEYMVIGVARHSENPDERLVVYQAQYDSEEFGDKALWVRPEKMFLENVEVNGEMVPRFRKTEDNII